ncbi:MAG: redoxin domain-containing protein [Chitinophagales bacterium]|nr:redoxin domain-containing protein [Chitinophagales bacterium]
MKQLMTAFLLFAFICNAFAQQSKDAPYQKQKALPAFSLKTLQNKQFTKANLPAGKPVLIFIFSPTCAHCAMETKDIIENMATLKKLSIVYASISTDKQQIAEFILETGIDAFPNIYLGMDTDLKLASFFRPTVTPFAAVYNSKYQLVQVFKDGYVMPKLLNTVKAL